MKFQYAATMAAVCIVLTACGGGGSSEPEGQAKSQAQPLALQGTVATSQALPAAEVEAVCAKGKASAVSQADGTYTLSIANGALPCMLRAKVGATDLFTATVGQTAHITLLTSLQTAVLVGVPPATAFAQAQSNPESLSNLVTAAALQRAHDDVVAELADSGLSGMPTDFGGATLLPTTTARTQGDTHALALQALSKAAQEGRTTADMLMSAMAGKGADQLRQTPFEYKPGIPLLPVSMQLRKPSSTCEALRQGAYKLVALAPSGTLSNLDPVETIKQARIDLGSAMPALATENDAEPVALTPHPSEPCHFAAMTESNPLDLLVTPSGVGVATYVHGDSAEGLVFLLVPTQGAISIADLAGNWNALGTLATRGAGSFSGGSISVGSDGSTSTTQGSASESSTEFGAHTGLRMRLEIGVRGEVRLADLSVPISASSTAFAQAGAKLGHISHNEVGDFDFSGDLAAARGLKAQPFKSRLIAYRSGTGDLMLLSISPLGELTLLTRHRDVPLPTVGEVSASSSIVLQGGGKLSVLATSSSTTEVLAVTGKSVTRAVRSCSNTFCTDLTTSLVIHDSPASGLVSSPAATSGMAAYTLPLRGIGLMYSFLPGNDATWPRLSLSVVRYPVIGAPAQATPAP